MNWRQTCLSLAYTLIFLGGSWGAFWISDEFDQERLWFYGGFLIPVGLLLPFALYVYRGGWVQAAPVFRYGMILILAGNLWGILLLVNAVSGDQPVMYTRLMESRAEQRSLRVAYRRGGLGLLYRLRW